LARPRGVLLGMAWLVAATAASFSPATGAGSDRPVARGPVPPSAVLDIDDDGLVDPLTDGLLVLRFGFGFTGAAFTALVVGDDCNRCDASTILPYLTGLAAQLDTLPLGSEFQVNTYTLYSQHRTAIGMESDGDFVVAWLSNTQDGANYGIFARRFNAVGGGLGAEFQVNTYTSNFQQYPSVGMDGDGDFVVAWSSNSQEGVGGGNGVFSQRFDSAGGSLSAEVLVNTHTLLNQLFPAVAMDGDGDFVVAWRSTGQDGDSNGIFARLFDAAGVGVGIEFQVNAYTSDSQLAPAVGIDADGNFVIAWASTGQDSSSTGVFARRFDAAGGGLGAEFQVNTYTSGAQSYPAVAVNGGGDFVVAWQSAAAQDGGDYGVFARRFDASGGALGAEFQVNAYTSGIQKLPALGMDGDGGFIVAWESSGQDGGLNGVFARRFDAAGGGLGSEFQVNAYTPGDQKFAEIGVDGDGDFVIAWESNLAGLTGDDVFAQRYATLSTLDVDGNGLFDPLTDGILVLRYLFDFTGANLVTGAVDLVGCTRCDAAAIEGYLQSLV
jgi:hypothetical protein